MADLESVLKSALATTFEEMAFLFLAEGTAAAEEDLAVAKIVFTRASSGDSGTFHLAVTRTLLPELAANMLGASPDEPPSAADQEDALREAANVVCGHFLPGLAGEAEVWNVSAPEIVDEADWRAAADSAACRASIALESGSAFALAGKVSY